MSVADKGHLFEYEVLVQQTTTFRTVVQAPSPGDAATMIGDKLRADDHTGLEVVSRIINDIEIVKRLGDDVGLRLDPL